jgi:hypothetical protein
MQAAQMLDLSGFTLSDDQLLGRATPLWFAMVHDQDL